MNLLLCWVSDIARNWQLFIKVRSTPTNKTRCRLTDVSGVGRLVSFYLVSVSQSINRSEFKFQRYFKVVSSGNGRSTLNDVSSRLVG